MGLADRLMPPQAAEISSYSANQEITSICADFLVVRPVPRNASPKANSLRAGKEQGISQFWTYLTKIISSNRRFFRHAKLAHSGALELIRTWVDAHLEILG
jgi:hypothetical protein